MVPKWRQEQINEEHERLLLQAADLVERKPADGTAERDALEKAFDQIEAYEEEHYDISGDASARDILVYFLDDLGWPAEVAARATSKCRRFWKPESDDAPMTDDELLEIEKRVERERQEIEKENMPSFCGLCSKRVEDRRALLGEVKRLRRLLRMEEAPTKSYNGEFIESFSDYPDWARRLYHKLSKQAKLRGINGFLMDLTTDGDVLIRSWADKGPMVTAMDELGLHLASEGGKFLVFRRSER